MCRGPSRKIIAQSAYCPNVGADLSVGRLINGHVQCAFNHWEYNEGGKCVKTGIGDKPPPAAHLFTFPSRERYGIIWVFNGEEPLFERPSFPYPDDELEMLNYKAQRTAASLAGTSCCPCCFSGRLPDSARSST